MKTRQKAIIVMILTQTAVQQFFPLLPLSILYKQFKINSMINLKVPLDSR
jgi:hypothetical protein